MGGSYYGICGVDDTILGEDLIEWTLKSPSVADQWLRDTSKELYKHRRRTQPPRLFTHSTRPSLLSSKDTAFFVVLRRSFELTYPALCSRWLRLGPRQPLAHRHFAHPPTYSSRI